jgi:ribulose-phosphate 3-epimerase
MRQKLDDSKAKAELEVDGGINAELAIKVAQAGAEVLVAGSAIFSAKQDAGTALRQIRKALESVG